MMYDCENVFAKILRGEIPCSKVYEDEHALAFEDINPQAPTHVLVIPKGAYMSMVDFTSSASDKEIAGFYRAVGNVAVHLGLSSPGYRIIVNSGKNGMQEVPHLHVHVLGGGKLGPVLSHNYK
jgi:histidine triad (HIT) family protein